jgi:hypothetical protein
MSHFTIHQVKGCRCTPHPFSSRSSTGSQFTTMCSGMTSRMSSSLQMTWLVCHHDNVAKSPVDRECHPTSTSSLNSWTIGSDLTLTTSYWLGAGRVSEGRIIVPSWSVVMWLSSTGVPVVRVVWQVMPNQPKKLKKGGDTCTHLTYPLHQKEWWWQWCRHSLLTICHLPFAVQCEWPRWQINDTTQSRILQRCTATYWECSFCLTVELTCLFWSEKNHQFMLVFVKGLPFWSIT